MAPAKSIWQTASAMRGLGIWRDRYDPTPLPSPSPTRNTARMIEKVYTVAPSIRDSKRVQITSAPSAHIPDKAIAMYTGVEPGGRVEVATASSIGAKGVFRASAKLISATVTLIATATLVAVAMSWTLSK